ncbi:MAG: methylmalonyl Co-A mutase-associated GTPase MeaB [Gemmatimonadota bacterium]
MDSRRDLIQAFRAGDERALARAISVVEDQAQGFEELLEALREGVGTARRIGVTGPPGAGKSTLTAELARLMRDAGRRVAIIAVDPTSPYTGGALLGDRIRMVELALEEHIFIRSMASRGSLGGLATATSEAADLMDAFGFDRVILETLGVGQSELEIAGTADSTVVVLVPESGDGVQAMKAGLMEVADVFCVNKADRPGADRLVKEIEVMKAIRSGNTLRGIPRHHARIGLGGAPAVVQRASADAEVTTPQAGDKAADGGWEVPVLKTVATEAKGVPELAGSLDEHFAWITESGELERRRRLALLGQTRRILVRRAENAALEAWEEGKEEFLPDLLAGRITPYRVARRLGELAGTAKRPQRYDVR